VAKYLPKPLRTVYRGGRAGAVNAFTSRNAAVIEIEGQSHERSDLCHRLQLLSAGFANQSHFTRVFSAAIGVSPGAWRREAQGVPEAEA
jgi:hypothetical protein